MFFFCFKFSWVQESGIFLVLKLNFWTKSGYNKLYRKKRGIYTVVCKYRRKRPNNVGKRPNFGIYFTPQPQKTTVNVRCFCKHVIKENKVTVTKADNKRRKKLSKESKDQHKLPAKEWNVLFSMPMSIIVWVHVSVILPHCNESHWRWIKICIYICFSTCCFGQRLHCPKGMSRYDYN